MTALIIGTPSQRLAIAQAEAADRLSAEKIGGKAAGAGVENLKPEKIVRPFEAFRERKDQALERLRAVPGESFEAELCWGEEPDFPGTPDADQTSGFRAEAVGYGFNTKDPPPEEPEEPAERDLAWSEEWNNNRRDTEKIRVENPDDAEQYVMVERLKVLYMRAPREQPFNGKRHKFTFKYK
jgi:hypothetical protein